MKKFLYLFLVFSFSLSIAQIKDISPDRKIAPPHPNQTDAIWDVLFDYNLQTISGGSLGKAGVCYVHTLDQIWVSYWNSTVSTYILNFSPAGVLIDSFQIAGVTGTRAFTFDGTTVYAGLNTTTIQRIDPVTRTVIGTIPAPQTVRYLTYDPNANGGAGGLWLGNFSTNLQLISLTGTVLQTWPYASLGVTSIYGGAYDNYSPGGPFLWLWGQGGGQGSPQIIAQINPATGLPTGVQHDVMTDVGLGNPNAIAGGLYSSKDLVPGKIALLGILQGEPDRLFAYEIGVTDAGPLNAFNLTSPPSGASVTTLPGSTTPVTITWDTSNANATYRWIFGSPTVPPRILDVPVGTNSLTLTLGQIDDILASLSVPQGDSVVGQWDVWAYRNNDPDFDSLKSTNGPWAVTLKRGIPALTPFSLVNPPDGITLVTSIFNNNPVTINWTKSGEGATYNWKFGVDVVASPILTVPSGNGGLDTSITLINSDIDGILAGLGLNPGDSVVGQWAVWAYSGSDSLKSTETFAITLKRQAKGDVLVAYDSTLTNGRINRDSVTAVLSRYGITYDLFNKGGNTSTNVISFSGYQKVFWLGEGTSIMSLVQKDSIKAYLNSGTPGNRSNLIIFGEDVGYMLGRAASTYYDLDFVNNYLGWNFLLDRPASGGFQGLIGLAVNTGIADSTIGPWPDVLGLFGTTSEALYHFRFDPTAYNAIGNKTANFEVATFAVDISSLVPAIDSPPGSPVERFVMAAFTYVTIPVELTSFIANVNQNSVRLEWSTASELNNSGFEVERSLAGSEYKVIGFVEGKGTTTETQNYSFTDVRLAAGKYSYRLKQIDFDGTVSYSPVVEVDVTQPLEFNLSQNYPNPFNPSTTIQFSLAVNSKVEMKVFDVLGQEVITLINKDMDAGYHEVAFDASNISSGVYFYRLETTAVNGQNFTSVKKMILTK
jgi:hypothetical protein